MERNSAACVMEWSIELEKALRSARPGRSHEAISEMGPKLLRLSREPECSPVVYHMFDLIPGEDKLFSKAIVLRLANAFESGDKCMRICILKAFLFEYRKRNKRKEYRGVLSKMDDYVQKEFLGRVKVVFDSGDFDDRALALGLFGCWAHFGKESPSIWYLVLSSMVSSHILEVEAALFAAACFAELSEDFAKVVLEMLVHMMNSQKTLPSIRLAGARVFAKIGLSHSIVNNAYKAGVKLLLECSDEDCQVAMLMSVSKLASRSTILIPEHADLLPLFLNRRKTVHLRGTALRCLHYIFSKGMFHFSLHASLVKTLFSMLDEPQLPSFMLLQALQMLHKMILGMLPNLLFDVSASSKLLTIATDVSPSPVTSVSMLAISVLVNMSIKLKGRTEMESDYPESLLPSRVILLIIDRITLVVKLVLDCCDTIMFQQVNVLLNHLVLLIRDNPDLHGLVLDQIFAIIKSISITHDTVMSTSETDVFVHGSENLKAEKGLVIRSKLVFRIYKFLLTFLENLGEAGAISTVLYDKVKILVEYVCQSNLFDCYTYTIYSLLLHHKFIWDHLVNESQRNCNLNRNSVISLCSYSVENETYVIEFAKTMVTKKNSWPAYRVGTYAACQGAWETATFLFEQLLRKVNSDSCYCWLKALGQFTLGEWKRELLQWPKQGSETRKYPLTLSCDGLGELRQDPAHNMKMLVYSRELAAAYSCICTSLETLKIDVTTGQTFYFQRWFLSLRAKLLGAVVDVIHILRNIIDDEQDQSSFMVQYSILFQKLTQISLHLKRLAHAFDLVTMAFIDMDEKSSNIISTFALTCSLLAFCSGFALYIPSLTNFVTVCGPRGVDNIGAILVQNLIRRLSSDQTSTNICLLWEASGKPDDCFHLLSRFQASKNCFEERDIHDVCSDAVSRFSCLKSKSNRLQNEEGLSQVTEDGLRILLDIIMKWMQVPFRAPKYFFKLRSCLGSELFAVKETRNPDGISVSLGFHLSLNLCLQLRNVPPGIPVQLNKLYCMLYCKVSFLEPRASRGNKDQELGTNYQAWEDDDMVEMIDKLLKYVTECSTRKSNKRGRGSNEGEFAKSFSFAFFELNDRGQGFSSCLLDVSGFPVGTYIIKWSSCCIDSQGKCWTLPALNPGPLFTVQNCR